MVELRQLEFRILHDDGEAEGERGEELLGRRVRRHLHRHLGAPLRHNQGRALHVVYSNARDAYRFENRLIQQNDTTRVRKLNLGWRFLASKVAFSRPSVDRFGIIPRFSAPQY